MYSAYFNSFLMQGFLEGFLSYTQREKYVLSKKLLNPFARDKAQTNTWSSFSGYCRVLVEMEDYRELLKFMYAILSYPEHYDLPAFYNVLSKFSVSDNNTLADICQDFYKYVNNYLAEKSCFGDEARIDGDLYHKEYCERDNQNSFPNYDITMLMPDFLAQKLYGISLKDEPCKEDADLLVRACIERRKKKHQALSDDIARINQNTAAKEEKHREAKYYTRKIPMPKYTDFDVQLCTAGVLQPLFCKAENNYHDICYYILQTYIWPLFANTPWRAESDNEVYHMAHIVNEYASYMWVVFNQDVPELESNETARLILSKTPEFADKIYSEDDFRSELLNGNGKMLMFGKKQFEAFEDFGIHMYKTFRKGRNILHRIMEPELYSCLLSLTAYFLYVGGHKKETASFIEDFYYETYQTPSMQVPLTEVPLVRSILETDDITAANILYGCYTFEMERCERDKDEIRNEFMDMTDFLIDCREYILKAEEYTSDSKESWYDLLFGDGELNNVIDNVRRICQSGNIPNEAAFGKLFKIVDSFSYPSGIRLSPLGIPNQDNYDKLPNALSSYLQNIGRGFSNRFDYYKKLFYQSVKLYDLRKTVRVFIQNHIDSLANATVQKTLDDIAVMKSAIKNENDDGNEQILSELDRIVDNLVSKLLSSQSRLDIETDIGKLQAKFINTYLPQENGMSLMRTLPEAYRSTVSDYLVTGEVVYRYLSSRADADQLDYSPALIPLTKALEVILHHVYCSMNVVDDVNLNKNVRSKVFTVSTNKRKSSLEFGPYIMLLSDYGTVHKKYNANDIVLNINKKHPYSHFTQWNGNNILDINKLQRFRNINITVQTHDYDVLNTYTVNFSNDAGKNREILALGLQYIKDNYRNIAAHKDHVTKTSVSDCKKLLLTTQNLLWILLSIIK